MKWVACLSPKMGERQRGRHISESSGSEPRAEHAVCRTIKSLYDFIRRDIVAPADIRFLRPKQKSVIKEPLYQCIELMAAV